MATATITNVEEFSALRRSVKGRLSRLRKTKGGYRNNWKEQPTPIERVGVFETEIEDMDRILKSMQRRIDKAKITIEL